MGGQGDRSSAPTLQRIVRQVEASAPTLTLYNADLGSEARRDIRSYFEVQSVDLRRAATDDGRPRQFFVLHDGDEFVEADGLRDVYAAIRPDSPLIEQTDPGEIDYPDLLRAIDETVFTDYGRRRMTLASREIEEHAYRNGGTLHAGFQELSNVQPQRRLYANLADAGVETHLYGERDWTVPGDGHAIHAHADPEITRSWFVVLDGDDADKRALLAEERQSNEFYGFWTYDPDIVDTVLTRLAAYPATDHAT
jgi:hypothetical protein